MKKSDIDARNETALAKIPDFRASQHPRFFGVINKEFHKYKNHFPYFGYIDVEVSGVNLVMFSGGDDLIALTYFWHGPSSYESYSLQIWSELAANSITVLDVGAFSGLYSLVAAAANPQADITAFEPSRRTHGRLLLNIYSNGFSQRITAVVSAVSNEVKQMNLLQFRGDNILGNGASLLEKSVPTTDTTEIVKTLVLDTYCANNGISPDLIKIDVEGAEVLVLDGMQSILSESRPKCLVEVTPQTANEVANFFKKHNYELSLIDETAKTTSPLTSNVNKVCNILAIPNP